MKKILLIEDRTPRQKLFSKETTIILEEYNDILDNCIEDRYLEIENNLNNDDTILNQYSIIMSHKSAFKEQNSEIISKLQNHCKINNKPLVLFSGGITVNYYNNEENEYLELNSKTFYSQNLKLFLENIKNEHLNILMLCYGERWMINIALNILEATNILIEQNLEDEDEIDFDIDLKLLTNINYKFHKLNSEYLSEVIKFRDSVEEYLKEFIDE